MIHTYPGVFVHRMPHISHYDAFVPWNVKQTILVTSMIPISGETNIRRYLEIQNRILFISCNNQFPHKLWDEF